MMNTPFVAVVMGSNSDQVIIKHTLDILKQFNIAYEVRILSAHRTPKQTHAYVIDADKRGCAVFIAAAGLAAHLAGAIASQTIRPVIGIPVDAGSLQGMDALLSTVQMPGGIPVATVAIGKAGAKNAAYLAAQILALNNLDLSIQIKEERKLREKQILQQNELPA